MTELALLRVLIVDNHDSFTHNLAAYLHEITGRRPSVVPHDAWDTSDATDVAARLAGFDAVVISPGPGTPSNPDDLGLSAQVIELYDGPVLGVCLGHQAMVQLGGGTVDRAPEPVHGRRSQIVHEGTGLFAGIPSPYEVVRYHSLVAWEVPEHLTVTARLECAEEPDGHGAAGLVMAVADKTRPRWGVQFHPESIGDGHGMILLRNFLDLAAQWHRDRGRDELYVHEEVTYAQADLSRLMEGTLRGNAFWLDSSADEGYSILGDDSGTVGECWDYRVGEHGPGFFSQLEERWTRKRTSPLTPPPVPGCDFAFGWVGYLGYELKGETEGHVAHTSPTPDAQLVYCERAIIVDHAARTAHVVALRGDTREGNNAENARWVRDTAAAVRECATHSSAPGHTGASASARTDSARDDSAGEEPDRWTQVHDKQAYLERIARAQELIAAGETYEVCLTNRLELPAPADVLATYRTLRGANPSPRAGYLDCGEVTLLSTSPECFMQLSPEGLITSRPIKGTRPRTGESAADAAAREDLRTSEKDQAENLMIVDLVRHDIAKVADEVNVPALFAVEEYATVYQLVSTVCGRLRPEETPASAIAALFPAGSMTGAPKERTLGIIDELEGTHRGAYSGAFGYISRNGAVDLSMTIRSLVVHGDRATYGSGGAIIALSDPEAEYAETMTKAAPLRNLLRGPGA